MSRELLEPREAVARLAAYDPQKFEVEIDLSANENSFGMPAGLRDKLARAARALEFNRYPDPPASRLLGLIAAKEGLDVNNIVVGNGGDELIQAFLLAYGGAGRVAAAFEPTFVMYKILSEVTATGYQGLARDAGFGLPADSAQVVKSSGADIIFVCSPNNPSGNVVSTAEVAAMAEAAPGAMIMVDEAYVEFCGATVRDVIAGKPNVVVLRTFSKAFSLAGLRVGYLLGDARVVANVLKVKLPYNVNVFSQAAAALALEDDAEQREIIGLIIEERGRLYSALQSMPGYAPYPSSANFILVRCAGSGETVWRKLLDSGILVRNFSRSAGLAECLRITIGTPEQNDAVLAALSAAAGG